MRKTLGRLPVILGTVLLSLGGFLLRLRQLNVGFDPMGLPTGQCVWGLVVLCLLSVAFFALAAVTREKRTAFADNFPRSMTAVMLSVLAAGLLLAGNVMALTEQSPMATPANQMLTRPTVKASATRKAIIRRSQIIVILICNPKIVIICPLSILY